MMPKRCARSAAAVAPTSRKAAMIQTPIQKLMLPRSPPRVTLVVIAILLANASDRIALASTADNNNNAAAPLTELQQYEISQALAQKDPLSSSSPDDGNNDDGTSSGSGSSNSGGITLPTSMGESALVDRESGRIFWQGGRSLLHTTSSMTLRSLGVRHVRATAMTFILVLAALARLAARLREMLQAIDTAGPWWQVAQVLAKLTVLLPRFDVWFVVLVGILYLVEAHFCSTRRYLANALSGPAAVETYVEGLRQAPPVAQWTVRCFHYERRKSLAWLGFLIDLWLGTSKNDIGERSDAFSEETNGFPTHGPSFLTKKVVTHEASKAYRCPSWQDETTVGLWKRAWTSDLSAPFTKLSLSKVLLLANAKARADYFKQQMGFVMVEGRNDQDAEFSTSIQVEGFKSKVLAVRPVRGAPPARLFRLHLFWIFTCLGMTVPYRMWFARHCDELRVTVIKETFANSKRPKLSSSSSWRSRWFARSKEDNATATSDDGTSNALSANLKGDFRRRMKELAIYQADEAEETRETAALLQQELDREQSIQSSRKDGTGIGMESKGTTTGSDQINGPVDEKEFIQASTTQALISRTNESLVEDRRAIQAKDEKNATNATVSDIITGNTTTTKNSSSSSIFPPVDDAKAAS